MVRPDRMALAAGGLLARAALGFIGLAILIGWSAPPPDPAATVSSQRGDPTQTAMTVTLRVPEGAMAKHLRVVDASGRELAILTQWMAGMTTVMSRCDGGAGVSYSLNTDGSANLLVEGPARVTLIGAKPDGTDQVSHQYILPRINRPACAGRP
jgi:hypothetical protein